VTAIGYTPSAEEAGARELVAHAVRAEEVGFRFAVISDHFHPWIDRQGQSPFVWGVLGAISKATDLNEHILGDHRPPGNERQERLAEAVEVIRQLWEGGLRSNRGKHYRVEKRAHLQPPAWSAPRRCPRPSSASGRHDHVYVHQVGPDQDGFFDSYAREVLPRLS
jgi:alkanesulfonate monooxygenase SsuD/methylene tetrahydromethanopterin reductase-like flavin-dependent oxidoreductase (luciferase family)